MLLPYTTDRPPKNPPLAVVSLVLIQFAMFGIVALILGVRGPDAAVIWYANLSLIPDSFRPHTFITYAFLHESLFHLSANMLFLWVFGGSVEDAIGWKRFLALYFAGVLFAGILEFSMASLIGRAGSVIPIVGASGAISAVIGVFAFRFYRSSIGFIGLPIRIPSVLLLAATMLLEMGLAIIHLTRRDAAFVSQAAAHWAHVSGFLFGILWARFSSAVGEGRLEYLKEDAQRTYERGAYPAAAHRWEELLRLHTNRPEYQAELGRSLLGMGDKEHALKYFTDAVRGLLKAGEKTEAAIRYKQMGSLSREITLTASELLLVAGSLDEQNETVDSIEALERLLTLEAAGPESEIARLKLGALYVKTGRGARANEHIRAYLERNPSSELRGYAEDLLRRAEKMGDTA